MIPVTQTKFGKEEGNCLMACAASILEKRLEDCPPLAAANDDSWFSKIHSFFLENAHYVLYLPCSVLGNNAPAGYSIATGPASRGLLHACVALDGIVVHDPHPSRDGLNAIEYYLAILPLAPGYNKNS